MFNDNKTRLLRPSLYDHFKNDTTVSFCYKPLPSDHKDDSTILLNFSKIKSRVNIKYSFHFKSIGF
ncbi:DUF6037 family protein [Erysipelatoclostridium ramosum]|nr:DUF6037 family protein [Thomasclavelia ramosa]MCB7427958.1 DUF6037 family protein [Thomasclavelia ramosa]